MATHVTLQFINGEILLLSTSSFLFRYSKLLQSFDIEEDNNIPIICSRSYIIDKNNMCLFDNKTDLSFMFTLQPNKFLEVCKFLDIICYENVDILYSKQFITYVMINIKKEINVIKYFMKDEIRSILNYLNNEDINIQIKSCTPAFYLLYLIEYKEEVIKHNRIDIYELSTNKSEYYRYIHKYDNHITFIVKETQEYNDYINSISVELFSECIENNVNNIKKLIDQGANINFKNKHQNFTALHAASYNNNTETIKYLVENGANVNLQNIYGWTALHYIINYHNNFEVIKILVENGININYRNSYGETALLFASQKNNNLEVIQYLVKHGAYINTQDSNGKTPLHFVIQKHKSEIEVINFLIDYGADINLRDSYDKTALQFALELTKKIEVIKALVENGANINLRAHYDNSTMLHIALRHNNNINIIRYLVEHSKNINDNIIDISRENSILSVNIQNINGCTPLHFASCNNNIEVIQYLVECGADINLKNEYGKNALQIASLQRNNKEVINYLQSIMHK